MSHKPFEFLQYHEDSRARWLPKIEVKQSWADYCREQREVRSRKSEGRSEEVAVAPSPLLLRLRDSATLR